MSAQRAARLRRSRNLPTGLRARYGVLVHIAAAAKLHSDRVAPGRYHPGAPTGDQRQLELPAGDN